MNPREAMSRIDGRLVYAVGDIHGRYDLLTDLLRLVVQDMADRAGGRRPVLIFCGDYIDRGPDSGNVLEALVWMKRAPDYEVRLLKGNHEDAFLAFMDDPIGKCRWLQVGGRATLRSYGIALPADPTDPDQCRKARDDLAAQMPASHLLLLSQLETMVVIGDYAFVHAGIRPEVSLDAQTPRDLMWIREGFLDRAEPFEKRIVHGHSWTGPVPEVLPNRVGIDTGAFKTGVLTAVRIEDGDLAILQTGGAANVVGTKAATQQRTSIASAVP